MRSALVLSAATCWLLAACTEAPSISQGSDASQARSAEFDFIADQVEPALGPGAAFAGSRGEAPRPAALDPKRPGNPDVIVEFATFGVRNTAVVGLDAPPAQGAAISPAAAIDPALTPFAVDTVKLGRWQLTGAARWDRSGTEKTLTETLLGIHALPRTRTALVYNSPWFGSYYAGLGDALNPAPAPLQLAVPGVPGDWGVLNQRPADAVVHEVGTKFALFGNRIAVRATAFRAEKSSAAISDESHRIDGVQVNAVGRLTPHWHVLAGYGRLDSVIVAAPDPAQLAKQLADTPPHAAKLWTSYAVPGFAIGGGARYVDRRMTDNANTRTAPEFVAIDASLVYRLLPQIELQLALQNIADSHWYDGTSGAEPDPAKARSAKLSSGFRF